MNEQAQNLDGLILAKRLPTNEQQWVHCNGYRCLAYLDHDGKWRAYSTGLLLLGVDVVSERLRMGSSDSGHIVPNL